MRNNALKLLILAALVLALGASLYAIPRRDVVPSFSQSGGAFVSNWYWLRPTNRGTVTYTFRDGNKDADITRRSYLRENCRDFQIPIVALVTDKDNGGAGHDKWILMTVTNEGTYEDKDINGKINMRQRPRISSGVFVELANTAAVGPSDPPGKGYRAQGMLVVPPAICDGFRLTGNLVVSYTYDSDKRPSSCCPGTNHHVAFNDPARWTDKPGELWRSLVIRNAPW